MQRRGSSTPWSRTRYTGGWSSSRRSCLSFRRVVVVGPHARLGGWASVLPLLGNVAPLLLPFARAAESQIALALGLPAPAWEDRLEVPAGARFPAALADLVLDCVEVRGLLAASRVRVESVLARCREFAPRLGPALQQELAHWPEIDLPILFAGDEGFLQHRLTRALELGPACDWVFGWVGEGQWDEPAESRIVARLSSAGPDGGLWLD